MSETIANIGEFGLIDRINNLVNKEGIRNPGLRIGIGDDAASFAPAKGYEIIVTCDSMVEGRHYLPNRITPEDLGRRAMTINLSDIGAMGGSPLYALVSLGLRTDALVSFVEDMYRGFIAELNPFNASLIGGNITRSDHSSFIDITLIGEVKRDKAVRRSSARSGDIILVTGYPGQAAAGLNLLLKNEIKDAIYDHPLVRAYNRPQHRAREGRAIGESGLATAMIDISDGFLGDLGHICEESGVGAEIEQDKMPVSAALNEYEMQKGRGIFEIFMQESDDYELIITCHPDNKGSVESVIRKISDVPLTEVGRITDAEDNIMIISTDGSRQEIKPKGWDHFRS